MDRPLNILILEDRPSDAELMLYTLRHAGFAPTWRRVETERDFLSALDLNLDIILADYHMPRFDAPRALELLHQRGLDIPFIIVSGTIGEDLAVEALTHGASDYLLKDRPARLGQAIERAIERRRLREERRAAEAALQASERRHRDLIEQMPALIYETALDDAAAPVYFSPQLEKLLGYTPGEGTSDADFWYRLVHPEDARWTREAFFRAKSTGEPFQAEYRVVVRDGRVIWVSDQAILIRDDAGTPLRWQGILHDITERKQKDRLLRQRDEQLKRIVEANADGLMLVDVDGRITLANSAAAAMFDTTIEEIVGQDIQLYRSTLSNSPPTGGSFAYSAAQLTNQAVYGVEHRVLTPAGRRIIVSANAAPLHDEAGNAAGAVISLRDVTERHHAEQQIRFQAQLLDHVRAAVIATDLDEVVLHWNAHAERLYGWSRDEVLGRPIDQANVGPREPSIEAQMMEHLQRGQTWTAEYYTHRKDGTIFPVEATMCAITDELGHTIGAVSVSVDITERKRTEEALRASESNYRMLLEQAADGIVVADSNWRILTVNSRACAMTGYAPEELHGRPVTAFIDSEQLAASPLRVAELASGATVLNERLLRHRNGTTLEVETSSKLLGDGRIQIILRDISERKRAEHALRAAEAKYRMLIEHSPAATYVEEVDQDLVTVYMSPQIERLTGYPPEKFLHGIDSWRPIVHPDDRGRMQAAVDYTNATGSPYDLEYRCLTADNRVVWLRDEAVLIRDDDGSPATWQGVITDITERKQFEEALRESEERFRNAFDHAPIGMALVALDGRWLQVNAAICNLTGFSEEELLRLTFQSITHPDDLSADLERVEQLLAGDIDSYQMEKRYVRRNGTTVWVLLSVSLVRDQDNRPAAFIAQVQDISARREYERDLRHHAFHDALTGLPNRALFLDRLEHAIARARGDDQQIAILFLDLDRFKMVNDSLGHEVGDRLLIEVAGRLANCVRDGDTIARLGGDEFTVLLEDAQDVRAATTVARRISNDLQGSFQLGEHELFVTASIGIVHGASSSVRSDELLRDADIAMYRAKAEGRNRFAVFDPSMNAELIDRLELEADLWRAMAREEFQVYYQPIVSLATGSILGVEALVRWNHPARGLVSPLAFVPIAEEIGLIRTLGRWVLDQAVQQLQSWHRAYPDMPPLLLNVNLSAREFQNPELVPYVVELIRRTGISPSVLQIEITESVVMADAAATSATLHELKALGLRLAIDDFGTGYSSLGYLKRLPVDTLKIDKGFVDGIGRDPEDTAIVEAVISMAHALGLSVTAEGVETGEAVTLLQALGCEHGQGYHFSKPLPAAELEPALAAGCLFAADPRSKLRVSSNGRY